MTFSKEIMLAPLSAVYGAVTSARLMLYNRSALAVYRVGAPVISVGNITTGGTGKTPLVALIARLIAQEGRRVSVLTRGYGRMNPGARVLVSDGERVLADAGTGGDEPRLLAEMLLGSASVISDRDRVAAARWAIENLGSEAFILDDGFQHLRIARDLDIVTIDGANPWGGGRLLPRGRLREPLKGLARADCIVITRAEHAPDIALLKAEASRLSEGCPVLLSETHTTALRLLSEAEAGGPHGQKSFTSPVGAFCAIGNPNAFFAHARKDGHTLSFTRSFPDHHQYRQSDVDSLVTMAQASGAEALLTTAKDGVKLRDLRFDLPCYVLEIEMKLDDEGKLLSLIRQAIDSKAR
jgi:tetraacyldisaccharide 4'-kinase